MTLHLIFAVVAVVLFLIGGYLTADRATKLLALGLALLAMALLLVR